MKIEFEQKSKEHIDIIGIDGEIRKIIGQIFTPSGSSEDTLNAIQVCGFKEAFDLWGCGMFNKAMCETLNLKRLQMKDIQLLFTMDSHKESQLDFDILEDCGKCYNKPCNCEVKTKYENPFTVKREQDLKNIIEKKSK